MKMFFSPNFGEASATVKSTDLTADDVEFVAEWEVSRSRGRIRYILVWGVLLNYMAWGPILAIAAYFYGRPNWWLSLAIGGPLSAAGGAIVTSIEWNKNETRYADLKK